jgi:hypothetical protein
MITASPPVEVLTSIAERLAATGMYASPEDAIAGLALAQIERETAQLEAQITKLENQWQMSFEEFATSIRNTATMTEEMAWEEWEDLRLKVAIRKKSQEAIRRYAASLG